MKCQAVNKNGEPCPKEGILFGLCNVHFCSINGINQHRRHMKSSSGMRVIGVMERGVSW